MLQALKSKSWGLSPSFECDTLVWLYKHGSLQRDKVLDVCDKVLHAFCNACSVMHLINTANIFIHWNTLANTTVYSYA